MYISKATALLAAIILTTATFSVPTYPDTDGDQHPIVGAWEMVEVFYDELDIFMGMVDTFFSDGTGISDFHGDILGFSWLIDGNVLTLVWDNDWVDSVMDFEISGSMMTQYNHSFESPGFILIFERID